MSFAFASAVILSRPGLLPPVAYRTLRRGHSVYHYVIADLSDGRVEALTICRNGLVPPSHLAADAGADVAITGTFFAPGDGTPVADVLVEGELAARGNRGSVFAVDVSGKPLITDRPFRRRFEWAGYRYGLRGGVRLITDGRVRPNPRAQAFRDPRIWGRAARTGIGITRAGKLILMATGQNVTLSEFGRAMRAAGALNALSLDGGGSACLYYHGKMLVRTGRRLSNMVLLKHATAATVTESLVKP